MMLTKFSVKLPLEELARLKARAEERNVSMTEILRQALALHNLLAEEVEKGNKIMIQQPDKSVREVILG